MRIGGVIADYRWVNRIGVRELAKDIGTSSATLCRVERGENCDGETLTKILSWLFAKNDRPRRGRPNDGRPYPIANADGEVKT